MTLQVTFNAQLTDYLYRRLFETSHENEEQISTEADRLLQGILKMHHRLKAQGAELGFSSNADGTTSLWVQMPVLLPVEGTQTPLKSAEAKVFAGAAPEKTPKDTNPPVVKPEPTIVRATSLSDFIERAPASHWSLRAGSGITFKGIGISASSIGWYIDLEALDADGKQSSWRMQQDISINEKWRVWKNRVILSEENTVKVEEPAVVWDNRDPEDPLLTLIVRGPEAARMETLMGEIQKTPAGQRWRVLSEKSSEAMLQEIAAQPALPLPTREDIIEAANGRIPHAGARSNANTSAHRLKRHAVSFVRKR